MLIRWRDKSGFPTLPANMFDDFFNTDLSSFFGRDLSDFFERNPNMVMPAVNIKETDKDFQIEVAAPGLRKEDFQIQLDHNTLTLSAQRESRSGYEPADQGQESGQAAATGEQTSGSGDQGADQNSGVSRPAGDPTAAMQTGSQNQPGRYTRREFSYTSFQRSFTLPETVEAEGISANYQDGILLITVPKREQAQVTRTRTIDIS
jgi:HSP20 family protein